MINFFHFIYPRRLRIYSLQVLLLKQELCKNLARNKWVGIPGKISCLSKNYARILQETPTHMFLASILQVSCKSYTYNAMFSLIYSNQDNLRKINVTKIRFALNAIKRKPYKNSNMLTTILHNPAEKLYQRFEQVRLLNRLWILGSIFVFDRSRTIYNFSSYQRLFLQSMLVIHLISMRT